MPHATLTQALDAVASGTDLTQDQAAEVLAVIMAGEASDVEIAGFLIGLRTKGETEDELAGLARTMRALATPVHPQHGDLLDTAGTGGGRMTFNVSTTAALIAAGAGCSVAKHGNRTATGLSGAADVLEALGASLDLTPEGVARCVDETGFGFMFAPAHHAATRHVVAVRRELAVRTIFNLLGPLTNPAGATRQIVGVADPGSIDLVAGALARLGTTCALVVSSSDGLDELSTSGTTRIAEVRDGAITHTTLEPQDVGLAPAAPESVTGGMPDENAQITRAILAGEPGPRRDLALLNGGAAIYAAGRAGSIAEGVGLAAAAVDGGAAARVLEHYVSLSMELAAS
jgi:anthranilate phosphoribosyltransferase